METELSYGEGKRMELILEMNLNKINNNITEIKERVSEIERKMSKVLVHNEREIQDNKIEENQSRTISGNQFDERKIVSDVKEDVQRNLFGKIQENNEEISVNDFKIKSEDNFNKIVDNSNGLDHRKDENQTNNNSMNGLNRPINNSGDSISNPASNSGNGNSKNVNQRVGSLKPGDISIEQFFYAGGKA